MAMLLWGYPWFLRVGTEKHEKEALSYYNEGRFQQALKVCDVLEEKGSRTSVASLIRGNIFLRGID